MMERFAALLSDSSRPPIAALRKAYSITSSARRDRGRDINAEHFRGFWVDSHIDFCGLSPGTELATAGRFSLPAGAGRAIRGS